MNNVLDMVNTVSNLSDEEFEALDILRRKAGQGSLTDSWVSVASTTWCAKRWQYRTDMMESLHQMAKTKHPSMSYAWSAIHEAIQAEIAKDLIGAENMTVSERMDQIHYDTMMDVWNAVVNGA